MENGTENGERRLMISMKDGRWRIEDEGIHCIRRRENEEWRTLNGSEDREWRKDNGERRIIMLTEDGKWRTEDGDAEWRILLNYWTGIVWLMFTCVYLCCVCCFRC